MKKWISIMLVCIMTMLVGCGNSTVKKIEGTLPDLMEKVLAGANVETMILNTEVNDTDFQSYFFVEPIKGAEGLVSAAAMSGVAHSIQLLRVPDGTDVEKLRSSIEANLDPRKWICVEAEKTAVKANGDLILVAMSTPEIVDKVVANFEELGK